MICLFPGVTGREGRGLLDKGERRGVNAGDRRIIGAEVEALVAEEKRRWCFSL